VLRAVSLTLISPAFSGFTFG
jgi:hypothetical protein